MRLCGGCTSVVRDSLPAAAGLSAVVAQPCLALLVIARTLELTQAGLRARLQLDGGGVDPLAVEELLDVPGHLHLAPSGLPQLQVTAGHNSPGECQHGDMV